MAFTWVQSIAVGTPVNYLALKELRDNTDYLIDNVACVAYDIAILTSYNNGILSSYDSSYYGSYLGGVVSGNHSRYFENYNMGD